MRFRNRRYRAINQQIREFRLQFSEEVYNENDGTVQDGPLQGFQVVDEFSWGGMADVTAKIFGYYEQQNLPILANSKKKTLVDIGAADGFFGVGLVYAGLFEQSLCFERLTRSKRIIRRTARANGVLDKVEIHGEFNEQSQQELIERFDGKPDDLFFLIDIEGGEFDALTYEFLWNFRHSELLVELHTGGVDFGEEKLERLLRDAGQIFDVSLITDDVRDASALNGIADMPESIRRVLLSEGREYPMQWMHLTPAKARQARLPCLPAGTFEDEAGTVALGSLWMGGSLGQVEKLCLGSMVEQGFEAFLFAYEKIGEVPEGVNLVDAREIFEPQRIIRNQRFNSPAIHADVFRYHLATKTNLTWVDTDMYFVKGPEAMARLDRSGRGFFVGRDHGDALDHCNNAVFDLPKESRTMALLAEFFEDDRRIEHPFVPTEFAETLNRYVEDGQPKPFEALPWGWTGPSLLTAAVTHAGELEFCQNTNAFYPSNVQELAAQLGKAWDLSGVVSEDSIGVHLWGRDLRDTLSAALSGRAEAYG